jgi:peptidyl-dipeptidase Dcp
MTRSRTFLSFILGSTMMTACAGITPDAAEAGDPVELAGASTVHWRTQQMTVPEATAEAAWSPGRCV